jgi:hypothetical protein
MSDDLIVVATFQYPYQAELAKLKLESEEIPCFIADEITYRTIEVPLLAGGIKLQVREEDAEKAKEILNREFDM